MITPETSWTNRTIDSTGHYFKECCYGNGVYLITCHNTNFVLYSTDGINWTLKTILSAGKMYSRIVYDGSYFISVASNSTYYMYSLDGLTWTEYSGLPSSAQWGMLRNLNGMLITYPVTFFTTNTYIVTMST